MTTEKTKKAPKTTGTKKSKGSKSKAAKAKTPKSCRSRAAPVGTDGAPSCADTKPEPACPLSR